MTDPLLMAMEKAGWNRLDKPETQPPPDDWEGTENQPMSLDQQKVSEQVRKLQIENEASLNNLILKKMIQAVLESVGQAIQTSFTDSGRREAPTMAAVLGIPERERDIESMINAMTQKGVEAVIAKIEQLGSEGTFS